MLTATLSTLDAGSGTTISSGNSWRGFTAVQFRRTSQVPLPADVHALLFNWSSPQSIQCKKDGMQLEGVSETGTLALLSSPPHSSTITFKEPADILAIYIETSFVDELLGVKDFRFQTQFNMADNFLQEIGTRIFETCEGELYAEKTYAESLVIASIEYMARAFGAARDSFSSKGKLSPMQLKMVIDHARSCMQFNVSLLELAGVVHLSPYHFGRLFKQTVGLSPYQYILQLRIEYAKKLIKSNAARISEIAYKLNFSDQSHFSNAFRKATGISPRQYLYS